MVDVASILPPDFERSFKEFNAAFKRFVKNRIPDEVLIIQKQVALVILADVVKNMRVDTGRARGNWQVTRGSVPTFSLLRVDKESKEGEPTFELGSQEIAKLKANALEILFISNNVEYINFLEEGTDKMTGDHMLELAIQRAGAQFS